MKCDKCGEDISRNLHKWNCPRHPRNLSDPTSYHSDPFPASPPTYDYGSSYGSDYGGMAGGMSDSAGGGDSGGGGGGDGGGGGGGE